MSKKPVTSFSSLESFYVNDKSDKVDLSPYEDKWKRYKVTGLIRGVLSLPQSFRFISLPYEPLIRERQSHTKIIPKLFINMLLHLIFIHLCKNIQFLFYSRQSTSSRIIYLCITLRLKYWIVGGTRVFFWWILVPFGCTFIPPFSHPLHGIFIHVSHYYNLFFHWSIYFLSNSFTISNPSLLFIEDLSPSLYVSPSF